MYRNSMVSLSSCPPPVHLRPSLRGADGAKVLEVARVNNNISPHIAIVAMANYFLTNLDGNIPQEFIDEVLQRKPPADKKSRG